MRRVVITGVGVVTPLGLNATETWNAALSGRSGISLISTFDTTQCPVKFAGEIKNFELAGPVGPFHPTAEAGEQLNVILPKDVKKMGRFIQFSVKSGLEAYADSGLDSFRNSVDPNRMGVNIGVGMGGLGEIEEQKDVLREKGFKRITPFFIPQVIPNLASGHLSILLNLRGPNLCNVTACSSSAHSIGECLKQIRRGEIDIAVAGGAEAVISPLGVGGFAAMRALSTRNEEPTRASRPFDVDRDGFVMGEGAATLILEEYEFAKKRGAKIYAEIVGYGLSGDAYHMTLPAPESEGGYRAMKMALADAKLNPEQVGYVNAHGTSTPAGDVEESRAIKKLFPQGGKFLHVSSTKSMTGHLLGAAGAVEAFFTAMALKTGKIPPTINLENLDPACKELGLDFTANQAVEKRMTHAMSNSFGFGGTNACLTLARI